MLFLKELKKICFSFVYLLFLGLLLFSWHDNFYGITKKEIATSKGGDTSAAMEMTGGSVLKKPEKGADSYGAKQKEIPEKIMCGGTDMLIIEYQRNSYATYPYTYYKEVVLDETKQKEISKIICEITGLNESQIQNLPDDYFPAVNGNILHPGASTRQDAEGNFMIEMENQNNTAHFISQVSYERFQELMKRAEQMIGRGSNYSMENLLQYYGLTEMTYEEAVEEYHKTIYDDKVSGAFARLFCDYMARALGLYPVFIVAIFWLKDRRNQMTELIHCKSLGTAKLIFARYFAILTAVMLPVVILSFESLIPLIKYSADTGIAIDLFAYLKYIVWWLLPTVMIVASFGMLLTILTSTPIAILIQFVWWFIDNSVTGLSGDTKLLTLMIRHNTLRGSEMISQDFSRICFNRGIFVIVSLLLVMLSILIYNRKRGEEGNHAYFLQKHLGFSKSRFLSHLQK